MVLNGAKSEAMYFCRSVVSDLEQVFVGDEPLNYLSVVKHLGVKLDRKLSWEPFIGQICSRVFLGLRRLYQIGHLLPQATRMTIVKSYIIPHIFYGDVLYFDANKTYLDRLERALNACTRFVFNLRPRERLREHRNAILGRSFDGHLKLRIAIFLFKLISTREPSYLYNQLVFGRSRRTILLIVPRHRTNYYASSIFVAGARIWNSLPAAIKNCTSLETFKRLASGHFK